MWSWPWFRVSAGGWWPAGWPAGIIVDLLTIPGCYDIALRDFGRLLGAVALARLAVWYRIEREQCTRGE